MSMSMNMSTYNKSERTLGGHNIVLINYTDDTISKTVAVNRGFAHLFFPKTRPNKTTVISKSFRPHVVHVYKQSMHIIRVNPSSCHT